MGNEKIIEEMKKKLLIFGYGYCAKYLSKVFLSDNWEVYGITRSAKIRSKKDIKIIFWHDFKKIKLITDEVDKIIVCTPPFMGKDPVLENFSNFFKNNLNGKWIGYLSSTSVYGNHKGDWVNESSKLKSQSKFGIDRINVEKNWQFFASKANFDLTIFRLSGIYGPNRNPFNKLKDKEFKCIFKENHLFNRIHVEDIALIIRKYISLEIKELVLNLSDDYPSSNYDFVKEASKLLKLKEPDKIPYGSVKMSDSARSFYEESKKVSNDKIKNILSYNFLHPDYFSGLKSIHKLDV